MTCLGPSEMFDLFLMFYSYKIMCFSMSNYLTAYNFFFYSYSSLYNNVFPPLKFCVEYLHFTGFQMKA